MFVDTKRDGVGLDGQRHDRCLFVAFFRSLAQELKNSSKVQRSAEGVSMPPAPLREIDLKGHVALPGRHPIPAGMSRPGTGRELLHRFACP
jgi:hypothetical protein